ncbi:MAG: hypothetical protein HYX93_03130 [Chloroflexi bacterium]|nr:hypothetical protein [Chloroflexota bacterium]
MSEEERSLEGWTPNLDESMTLAQVVELAFDYRGNVTMVKSDGTEVVGYIFNRDNTVPEPFIQIFDEAGGGPFKIPYSELQGIRFTGKDMAAGKSYEAWLRRKQREADAKGG